MIFGGLAFGFGIMLPVLMTSLAENRERIGNDFIIGCNVLGKSVTANHTTGKIRKVKKEK